MFFEDVASKIQPIKNERQQSEYNLRIKLRLNFCYSLRAYFYNLNIQPPSSMCEYLIVTLKI